MFITTDFSPENTDPADLYLVFICRCMACVRWTVFQATFWLSLGKQFEQKAES